MTFRGLLVSTRSFWFFSRPTGLLWQFFAQACQWSPCSLRINRPVVIKLLHANPAFPLCASAAGLRCIMHEHSVNLLIQNMSFLFLCLIYCPSFLLSVRADLRLFHAVFPPLSLPLSGGQLQTQRRIRWWGEERGRRTGRAGEVIPGEVTLRETGEGCGLKRTNQKWVMTRTDLMTSQGHHIADHHLLRLISGLLEIPRFTFTPR